MKLSVCITTYNHERYIAQAIESVLMQEVNFPYEVLIGEDQSSDNTRAIVFAYHQKHPELIRLFLHDHPSDHVHVNGRQNFVNNIANATGQYVALLEGDDYWTCPSKLQKQVDLLDHHPEYAICCHNTTEFFDSGEQQPWNFCPPETKETSTLEDLLVRNWIPTCSVVFRRGLFSGFPDWYFRVGFGDWPLHILNAEHGDIYYFDEIMGAHRHHPGGVWSRKDPIEGFEEANRFYSVIRGYLGSRYDGIMNTAVSKLYYDLAMAYCFRKDYVNARKFLLKGLVRKPLNKYLLSWALIRTFGRSILNSQWVSHSKPATLV